HFGIRDGPFPRHRRFRCLGMGLAGREVDGLQALENRAVKRRGSTDAASHERKERRAGPACMVGISLEIATGTPERVAVLVGQRARRGKRILGALASGKVLLARGGTLF